MDDGFKPGEEGGPAGGGAGAFDFADAGGGEGAADVVVAGGSEGDLGVVFVGLHRLKEGDDRGADGDRAKVGEEGFGALFVFLFLVEEDFEGLDGIDDFGVDADVGAGLFAAGGTEEPAGDAGPGDAVGVDGEGDRGADDAAGKGVLVFFAIALPGVVDLEEVLPLGGGAEAGDAPFAGGEACLHVGFSVAEGLGRQRVEREVAECQGHEVRPLIALTVREPSALLTTLMETFQSFAARRLVASLSWVFTPTSASLTFCRLC